MNRGYWVFRKELREMYRDRRVVTGALVMPFFFILMFAQLIGVVEDKVKKPPLPKVATIGMAGDSVAEALVKGASGQVVNVKTREEGLALVQKGDAKVLVEFDPGFAEAISRGGAKVVVTYDPTEPLSGLALGTVSAAVQKLNESKLEAVLASNGIQSGMAQPVKLDVKEAAKPKGLGGSSLAGLLPYLIVIWAFYGGFSIASDLVAGEKERGTLETLLVTPAQRTEIAVGKYFALAVVCLFSSLTSLVAILSLGALGRSKSLFPTGFTLSGPTLATLGVALLPLVLMFAAILLLVSALAKNMREAQTYLTLVSFVVIMPAVFSQVLGFTGLQNAAWIKWTPVLGSAVCLREALLGKTDWAGLGAAVLVDLVLAGVCLTAAVAYFKRERILART